MNYVGLCRFFLTCTILVMTFGATATSFNCNVAVSRIEKTICASAKLSKLDSELDTVYKTVLSKNENPQVIKTSQRSWLKEIRNLCADEQCLASAYEDRIHVLRSFIPIFANEPQQESQLTTPNPNETIAASEDNAVAKNTEINAVNNDNSKDLVASLPIKTEVHSDETIQQKVPTSQPKLDELPQYEGPTIWERMEVYVWEIVGLVGLVIIIFAVYAGYKKKLSFLSYLGLFVFGGVASTVGNDASKDAPEKQFFKRAQSIEIITLIPSAEDLKFGMSAKSLPKNFVLRPITAEHIKSNVDLEYSSGIPSVICYDNHQPLSRVFVKESACFDHDRLLTIGAEFAKNLSNDQIILGTFKSVGSIGGKNIYSDSYSWERSINGVKVKTHLELLPQVSYFIETLEHAHKH